MHELKYADEVSDEIQAKLTALSDKVIAEGFVPMIDFDSSSSSEASFNLSSSPKVDGKPWSREGRFADLLDKLDDLRVSLRRSRCTQTPVL